MTATDAEQAPGPAVTGPGAPAWRLWPRRAAAAGPAVASLITKPFFWLVLLGFVFIPAASSLILAVSPRLFSQGNQWFTLTYLAQTFSGSTALALFNSIWVGAGAAVIGLVLGFPLAWLAARTNLPGRRLISLSMWLLLLLPSWLPGLGWVRLVESNGVLDRLGIGPAWLNHAILGPAGVVLVLGVRGMPFTFLAITAGLAGLGQEFEDAARVHGASRAAALRVIVPMLAPAIWSALAIGFAESVSDFGVAATLAYSSNFNLGTYQIFNDIGNFPPNFPGASAMGLLLVAAMAIPLTLQARALRGRSYQILSGRNRQVTRRRLSPRGMAAAVSFTAMAYLLALVIPAFGAVSASLFGNSGSSYTLTLMNYRAVFAHADLFGPLGRSIAYGLISASITVVGGFAAAWMLAQRRARASRLLDLLLLGTVALPTVLFGVGYILAFNLPFWSGLGVNLYQTATLLVIAYTASSLPTNARVLTGAVAQIPPSLRDAARTHGAGPILAWARGVLPVVSRPLMMAWLVTFTAVFLELPLSQLLYQPNSPPVSVAIEDNLGQYHFGVGMAQSVVAVGIAFAAVGVVLGGYRLLAPAGWRRIGTANRG